MDNLGLIGILVLAADVYAILQVAQSAASNTRKVLWIVAILVLPVLGLIAWFFLGPREGR